MVRQHFKIMRSEDICLEQKQLPTAISDYSATVEKFYEFKETDWLSFTMEKLVRAALEGNFDIHGAIAKFLLNFANSSIAVVSEVA